MNIAASKVAQGSAVTEEQPQPSREAWVKVPRALVRDASLTPLARLLLIDLLERRYKGRAFAIVKRPTLAADLGVSLSTLDRALAELIERGLLEVERLQGVNRYRPMLPKASEGQPQTPSKSSQVTTQVVMGDDSKSSWVTTSDKQDVSSQMQSKQAGPAPDPAGSTSKPAAATRSEETLRPIADSMTVWAFAAALPRHLQPTQTDQVAQAVGQATARGWTPSALAAAVAAQITNPKATPALTVAILRQVAQQPPQEQQQEGHSSGTAAGQVARGRRLDPSELEGVGTPETAAAGAAACLAAIRSSKATQAEQVNA